MIKYLKTRWKIGVLALLMVAVTAGILFLYDIPLEPVGYVAVFEMLLTGLGLMWDYHKYRKKQESLLYIRDCGNFSEEYLEAPENENEAIYREICRSLDEKRIEAENQRSAFGTELTDFYTLWVHQIKTPIAAARLLLQEKKPRPQEIQNELFKVEQYVEMVLGYLRTEDMASDIRFEEVDMDSLIREQIHKFARIFIGKKLSLEYQEVSETVLTDEKWLGFVLGQILSNALKYTKKGKISIYMSKSRPHTLVIEDTGIGMASEYLPHIFDEFSREHTATENKVSGTGLGLSIVKSFVELMNGRIHVESEPGKGTKFTVEIPLELASEEDICKKELPEQTFMTDKNIGKRILLAEDNELNAEIAMELLKEEGFLIDWVKDGQECFDKLEEADEGYYDLILMDIQMPILNGYDTTAKIRQMENPKKAATPIVAMTANSFDEDIEMTKKAGMNGFIAKPLDAEKMFIILKQSIVEN